MELGALRSGLRAAIASFRQPAIRRFPILQQQQARRWASTTSSPDVPLESIRAAPPVDFESTDNDGLAAEEAAEDEEFESGRSPAAYAAMMNRLRIIPASPDDLLNLENLLRKYQTLPVLPTGHAPRIAWKTLVQYKMGSNEPVKAARYTKILQLLQRLNYIHPNLVPIEVTLALRHYMRDVQPYHNQPKPGVVDEYGRARGVGRRKSSNAVAYLVEGEGEVLINGKPLTQAFGRLHDRESALWALKATERMDKYNVWCVARGGGTTGQADAIALAVSKALMVHEPSLKPALRRGELFFHPCPTTTMLTGYLQLVSSRGIPVVSRERSPESSRPARCPPGSSVRHLVLSVYKLYLSRVQKPVDRLNHSSLFCTTKTEETSTNVVIYSSQAVRLGL
jgi:small subunit ribosomal protein S9